MNNEFLVYISVWVFILGLCIGSFLNVVILRGLAQQSIVFPPSKCPKCNKRLKWWMNIPVLSYLFLKGSCFYCKSRISIQYPVVELSTAVVFLLIFIKFGLSLESLFFCIACALLIVMSVCDIKESVIIDLHAYILIFFGLLFQLLMQGTRGLLFGLAGAVIGFLIYEVLGLLGYPLAGQRAFGEGDSLIAAGIGSFFGWALTAVSVFLSIILMVVFIFPKFIIHCIENGKKRTLISLFCALLLTVILVISSLYIKTFFGALFGTIVSAILAIICCFGILTDKKTGQAPNYCSMPFGPSMAASFFILIFFASQIVTFLEGYFHISM